MGVLKLSVIEEQNKQLKSKLRVVEQKETLFVLATVIVHVSVSLERARSLCVTMSLLLEVGTLINNNESLVSR